MTLSDADEILPLIDRNRRDQGASHADYHSLGCSSKRKSSILSSESSLRAHGNTEDLFSALEQRITYSWDNLNVCHIRGNAKENSLWRKLTRRRRLFQEPKQILKNVYGVAYPGELLAIMGASGAGKTTLLNALTFQSGPSITVEGSRCLNGIAVVDQNDVTEYSAYVEQENLFIGTLTVKEHLIFHSLLRINRNVPYERKVKRVEDVITELGLEKCQHTIIGYEGRIKGISGGERKRLSFASEILTNPPIMFCDEPTSGLDSFMALNVINVLKSMAIRGKTVICTIHQPSSEIFSLFDKILLLAEGRTAFLGKPTEAISFFQELGASTPPNYNPADFFIQLLAVVPNQEENCKRNVKYICDLFDQSSQGLEIARKVKSVARNQVNNFNQRCNLKDLNEMQNLTTPFLVPENFLKHCIRQHISAVTRFALTVIYNGYNLECAFNPLIPRVPGPGEDITLKEIHLQLLKESRSNWRRCNATLGKIPERFTYPATRWCQFRTLLWRSWLNTVKEPILVNVRLFQTMRDHQWRLWSAPLAYDAHQMRGGSFVLFYMIYVTIKNPPHEHSFLLYLNIAEFLPFHSFFLPSSGAPTVQMIEMKMLSLIVGLIYHGQKLNEDGVMNINGVLFTFLTNMTFQNLFAVISVFCSELPVFMKEQSIKLYRVDMYFLSKTLAEIPLFLVIPIIFTCITYYWIGLNSSLYRFSLTVLILILVTNVATSFGYFISCISKNVVVALSIGPPVIIPFLLFGGFLLNAGAIPAYFKWLSYLSWFKYGNEALLINQWSDIKNIECNMSVSTCPRNGEIVLEVLHFEKDNFWVDLGSLVMLILLFRTLAFLALLWKVRRR